jgi:hypothetical protein
MAVLKHPARVLEQRDATADSALVQSPNLRGVCTRTVTAARALAGFVTMAALITLFLPDDDELCSDHPHASHLCVHEVETPHAPKTWKQQSDDACLEAFASAFGETAPGVSDIDALLPLSGDILTAIPEDRGRLKRSIWWRPNKHNKLHWMESPDHGVFPSARLLARGIPLSNSTRERLKITAQSNGGPFSEFIFCPGKMRIEVRCLNCRQFEPTENITLTQLRRRWAENGTLERPSDLAPECEVLPPWTAQHAATVYSPTWSPGGADDVIHGLLQALRFGPAGIHARIDGPQRIGAYGTWWPSGEGEEEDDVYAVELDTTLPAPLAAPIGSYQLSVTHSWSGWLQVIEAKVYALSRLDSLLNAATSSFLLLHSYVPPPPSSSGRLVPCEGYAVPNGRWVRFDSIAEPIGRRLPLSPNASDPLVPPEPFPAPLVRVIAPMWTYGIIARSANEGRFLFARRERGTVLGQLPPSFRHHGRNTSRPVHPCEGHPLVPSLLCAAKRRVWKLLHATDGSGTPIFANKTFVTMGESHVTQFGDDLKFVADGSLAHSLASFLRNGSDVITAVNGVEYPYTRVYDATKPPMSWAPAGEFTKRKAPTVSAESVGVPLTIHMLDNMRSRLEAGDVPHWAMPADYVFVCFGLWRISLADRVDDASVTFARYLLGLHGLGPSAKNVPKPFTNDTVVVVAAIPTVEVVQPNWFTGEGHHRVFDYWRIKRRDHRTHFSLRLWGMMAMRTVAFVNAELAKAGRRPVVALDFFTMTMAVSDSAEDGDHYSGNDANLEMLAEMLMGIVEEKTIDRSATAATVTTNAP